MYPVYKLVKWSIRVVKVCNCYIDSLKQFSQSRVTPVAFELSALFAATAAG